MPNFLDDIGKWFSGALGGGNKADNDDKQRRVNANAFKSVNNNSALKGGMTSQFSMGNSINNQDNLAQELERKRKEEEERQRQEEAKRKAEEAKKAREAAAAAEAMAETAARAKEQNNLYNQLQTRQKAMIGQAKQQLDQQQKSMTAPNTGARPQLNKFVGPQSKQTLEQERAEMEAFRKKAINVYDQQKRENNMVLATRDKDLDISLGDIGQNLGEYVKNSGKNAKQSIGIFANAIGSIKNSKAENLKDFLMDYDNASGDEQANLREGLAKARQFAIIDGDAKTADYIGRIETVFQKDGRYKPKQKDQSFGRQFRNVVDNGGFVNDMGDGFVTLAGNIAGWAGNDEFEKNLTKQQAARRIDMSDTGMAGVVDKALGFVGNTGMSMGTGGVYNMINAGTGVVNTADNIFRDGDNRLDYDENGNPYIRKMNNMEKGGEAISTGINAGMAIMGKTGKGPTLDGFRAADWGKYAAKELPFAIGTTGVQTLANAMSGDEVTLESVMKDFGWNLAQDVGMDIYGANRNIKAKDQQFKAAVADYWDSKTRAKASAVDPIVNQAYSTMMPSIAPIKTDALSENRVPIKQNIVNGVSNFKQSIQDGVNLGRNNIQEAGAYQGFKDTIRDVASQEGPMGREYTQFEGGKNPEAAIDYINRRQQGVAKRALPSSGDGNVDLPYGRQDYYTNQRTGKPGGGYGLAHGANDDGRSLNNVFQSINDLQYGNRTPGSKPTRVEYHNGDRMTVLSNDYKNNPVDPWYMSNFAENKKTSGAEFKLNGDTPDVVTPNIPKTDANVKTVIDNVNTQADNISRQIDNAAEIGKISNAEASRLKQQLQAEQVETIDKIKVEDAQNTTAQRQAVLNAQKNTDGSQNSDGSQDTTNDTRDYSETVKKAVANDPEMAAIIKEGTGIDLKKKKVAKLEEQKIEAQANIDKLNDNDFVARWSDSSRELRGEQNAIEAHFAYNRARAMGNTELSANILRQITDGAIAEGTSGAGRMLRMAQEFAWSKADAPTKKNIMFETVEKTRKKGDLPPLTEAEQVKINELINRGVSADEMYSAAYLKGQDAAINSGKYTVEQANELVRQVDEAQFNAESEIGVVNNELAKFMPKSSKGEMVANWMKTSMLSNPLGRLRDVAQTQGAAALMKSDAMVTNLINRGINKLTGHKYGLEETVFKGSKSGNVLGLKQAKRNLMGKEHASNLFGSESRVTQMTPSNKAQRLVSGSTEVATDLVEGLRTSKAYSLADAANKKAGLSGDDLAVKNILDARFDKNIRKQASDYSDRASFLQDNKVTDALNSFARVLDRINPKGGGGKIIRNTIIPFTNVSGGKIHEALTKRNVVANIGALVRDAKTGNVAGVTDNIGRLVVNGGIMGAGLVLAGLGMISTEDANGDNYDLAYLKVGDQYVPMGVLPGGVGVSLLTGAAIENDDLRKDFIPAIQAAAGTTDTALGKSPIVQMMTEGAGEDKTARAASALIRSMIPAFFTTVNAVTDTGQQVAGNDAAIDTKVTKTNPETGKDVKDAWATEWNKVVAKIPGLREMLPRTDEKAASNVVDVFTQGSHVSETMKNAPEKIGGKIVVSSTDWYNIMEKDGKQTIKRKDDQKAGFSGDVGGLNQDQVNLLSMTSSEVERDAEDNKWDTQAAYFEAKKRALENELEAVKRGYNEGKRSKQDIAKAEKDIASAQKNQTISNVNHEYNNSELFGQALAEKGLTTYDIAKLYDETSLTEWRKLSDGVVKQLLAEYDSMRTGSQVSGKSGDPTSNKYYGTKGKGGGGKGKKAVIQDIITPKLNFGMSDVSAPVYFNDFNKGRGIVKGLKAPRINTQAQVTDLPRVRIR